jgi:hypothetical protein
VFEKPETTGFEEADDAVTFAPDIQVRNMSIFVTFHSSSS